MLASLRTTAVFGVEALLVHVEVDVSFGLPQFTMVGLPDASVRESRDRVRSAIRNAGFRFPPHRITVNLAPADVRKAGASFDLPIALGVLAASGEMDARHVHDGLFVGELSLDGAIVPTRGVLAAAVRARREGLAWILVASGNAAEATAVDGVRVLTADTLADAVEALRDPERVVPAAAPARGHAECHGPDFSDVRGQTLPRRALEIAAAGGHHVLLVGPPGSGKSMLARRLPGILPPLSIEEAMESTTIHSVAGLLPPGRGLLTLPPFRAPHHTVSDVALVGGGSNPRPGEISLAHNGVLFLDEAPEFSRRALEVLRQPLEAGCVHIARAARTLVYPARFMLVAAMNPCPCGHLGSSIRECRCTPQQIARYQGRLSGPLRDRIDLTVDVPAVPASVLGDPAQAEPSAAIRARVLDARARQRARLDGTGLRTNADLPGRVLRQPAVTDRACFPLLEHAAAKLGLSARAYHRVLRLARTIADLEGAAQTLPVHVAEALQYREASPHLLP